MHCIPKTYTTLCINYISIKEREKKEGRKEEGIKERRKEP